MLTEALQARFRMLLESHVQRLTIRNSRATGLSPCHEDRSPSFSADVMKCVWFCHACGRGGGVRELALLVGESWQESPRGESRSAKAHRDALAAACDAYRTWERQQFNGLIEQYRLLEAECEFAEIAYRAIHRRPDLYTQEEYSFWTRKLASIYNRLAPLEHHLDLFTFSRHEAARFAWWQEVKAEEAI